MKSISSLPLLAKVGGGSVAAAGAITGGVFLHKHFEFPKGLDKELIDETEAALSVSESDNFSTVTNKDSEVTLKVKTTSSKTNSKFSGSTEKWTCTIRGIAKEGENNVTLTLESASNFDKSTQKTKFTSKFDNSENKNKNKEGFVKSCARNRSKTPTGDSNWTSELVFLLKKDNDKWVFEDEHVNSAFEGTWINPEIK